MQKLVQIRLLRPSAGFRWGVPCFRHWLASLVTWSLGLPVLLSFNTTTTMTATAIGAIATGTVTTATTTTVGAAIATSAATIPADATVTAILLLL